MVRLTRIYTRGGDTGETSLGDGARVAKHDPRVEAFGTVDEANAAIGLARLSAPAEADAMLARIQNDLFDLGADLCTPEDGRRAAGALRIHAGQVARLEQEIDAPPRRPSPPRAARPQAGRAPGRRTGRTRGRQSRGAQISQPAVGPFLRSQP